MITHKYGKGSRRCLKTCHPILQEIAKEALRISPYDITIIYGLRGEEEQTALYMLGKSKLQYPLSRHNRTQDENVMHQWEVSDALDFAPYKDGIDWDDGLAFAVVAGCFMGAAENLGYRLRWGGDWDMDGQTTDQTFMDLGHLEIYWRI